MSRLLDYGRLNLNEVRGLKFTRVYMNNPNQLNLEFLEKDGTTSFTGEISRENLELWKADIEYYLDQAK